MVIGKTFAMQWESGCFLKDLPSEHDYNSQEKKTFKNYFYGGWVSNFEAHAQGQNGYDSVVIYRTTASLLNLHFFFCSRSLISTLTF